MIIPVRCFTCNKVLADKWMEYKRRCDALGDADADADADANADATSRTPPVAATPAAKAQAQHGATMTPRGIILNELGITQICCRRIMLTHVDLMSVV